MTALSNMVTPKVEREAEARNYGKFVIGPLESGYGITLGNALRRVMLSSLEGAAVTSVRVTDVPSMLLKPGDELAVREGSRDKPFFKVLREVAEKRTPIAWLERDLNNLSGKMLRLPERGEIDGTLNEQLIVEYYSR